jgi:hypothetical protein
MISIANVGKFTLGEAEAGTEELTGLGVCACAKAEKTAEEKIAATIERSTLNFIPLAYSTVTDFARFRG